MPKSKPSLAAQADKYTCYQQSVQEPSHEVEFFDLAFNDAFGRKAVRLREDFCGTFAVCCEWVKSSENRSALGIDLDPEPLAWGKAHNLTPLSPAQQKRIRLREQDVRRRNRPAADIVAAQNFSFWLFKTRADLRDYFKTARANLADQGLLVMDMMGGGDCYIEGHTDKRTIKKGKRGYKYFWHQESYNPVTPRRPLHHQLQVQRRQPP